MVEAPSVELSELVGRFERPRPSRHQQRKQEIQNIRSRLFLVNTGAGWHTGDGDSSISYRISYSKIILKLNRNNKRMLYQLLSVSGETSQNKGDV